METLKKHKQRIIVILLGVSLVWAVISTLLFFSDFGRLRREGHLPPPGTWRDHRHFAPTLADVDHLEIWMTFGFIEKRFALPPEYLKHTFSITSTAPDLTIKAGATALGTSTDALLASIKGLLRTRLATTTATTTR